MLVLHKSDQRNGLLCGFSSWKRGRGCSRPRLRQKTQSQKEIDKGTTKRVSRCIIRTRYESWERESALPILMVHGTGGHHKETRENTVLTNVVYDYDSIKPSIKIEHATLPDMSKKCSIETTAPCASDCVIVYSRIRSSSTKRGRDRTTITGPTFSPAKVTAAFGWEVAKSL